MFSILNRGHNFLIELAYVYNQKLLVLALILCMFRDDSLRVRNHLCESSILVSTHGRAPCSEMIRFESESHVLSSEHKTPMIRLKKKMHGNQ
jgi:hypothetical protein